MILYGNIVGIVYLYGLKSHYFNVIIMNRDVGRDLCEEQNVEPFVHLTRITNVLIIALKTAR